MKKHKIALLFLVGVTILIFSMGFQKDKSKEAQIQELIDSKVAAKVEGYRKKYLKKCQERILERASELADTVMLESAKRTSIIDKTNRPIPPSRPLRPDAKPPIDTTPVKPFFLIDTTQ